MKLYFDTSAVLPLFPLDGWSEPLLRFLQEQKGVRLVSIRFVAGAGRLSPGAGRAEDV